MLREREFRASDVSAVTPDLSFSRIALNIILHVMMINELQLASSHSLYDRGFFMMMKPEKNGRTHRMVFQPRCHVMRDYFPAWLLHLTWSLIHSFMMTMKRRDDDDSSFIHGVLFFTALFQWDHLKHDDPTVNSISWGEILLMVEQEWRSFLISDGWFSCNPLVTLWTSAWHDDHHWTQKPEPKDYYKKERERESRQPSDPGSIQYRRGTVTWYIRAIQNTNMKSLRFHQLMSQHEDNWFSKAIASLSWCWNFRDEEVEQSTWTFLPPLAIQKGEKRSQ